MKPDTPSFHIACIPIHGEALLSPMDGYSDWPFRSLCRGLGSAISYTEFVKAEDVLARREQIADKLRFTEDERPLAIQLYGDDATTMCEAALRLQELRPDFIDINMGCPAKTIANRGAGAGLLRTPVKVARILRVLTASLAIPVTVKIRLGWDDDSLTYPLIARIAEAEGAAAIAVHGRTKVQGYGGQTNWDAIAEVVQSVKIPVIGNGDIKTVPDIERMKNHTGCNAVMIGRAAISNPWVFARLDRAAVSSERVRATLLDHLERSLQFYGPARGLVLFRKYAAHYLSPYRLPKEVRQKLLTRQTPAE
ncbi:MAG: tRNA dihydrouridine synthase DusB, partial [Anaerolineales bacterium]|nr:tRNA dihydrouridine synthase DusB [Anaerolineales bacterium]